MSQSGKIGFWGPPGMKGLSIGREIKGKRKILQVESGMAKERAGTKRGLRKYSGLIPSHHNSV